MKHLWESIDTAQQEAERSGFHTFDQRSGKRKTEGILPENISKSKYIKDKDNWFYENVLKEMLEYKYNEGISNPPIVFELQTLWVNYQKQHEFNPPHNHNGGHGFSFVVFMKIPTHWKEQHAFISEAMPISVNFDTPCASDFQFLLPQKAVQVVNFPLSPEDEGRILFFPSWLKHQVFPFYGTKKERITISGNIGESSTRRPKNLYNRLV